MLTVAIASDFPADPQQVAAQTVSRSCEDALGRDRCPTQRELRPAAVVTWFASIRPDEPGLPSLRVEFRDRSLDGTLIETRILTFSTQDSNESRWASAGAVVASFVAARDARPSPASNAPSAPTKAPAPKVAAARGRAWGFDLALLTGPGLDPGAYRLGGLARGFIGLVPRAPGVLGVLSLRYAQRPGSLDATWLSGSWGIGARIGGRNTPLSAELTGELAFERLLLSAENPLTGHRDQAGQNRFGGRLGVNFAWAVWPELSLIAGAEATAMRPALSITVADVQAGRERPVGLGLSLGLRVSR